MDIEFAKLTGTEVQADGKCIRAQVIMAGSEGADNDAEQADSVETVQPLGLLARPTITDTAETVTVRRGDEVVVLFVLDKAAVKQDLEEGEVRMHGVSSSAPNAVIRIRASGDIEITPAPGCAVKLAGGATNCAKQGSTVDLGYIAGTAPVGGGPVTFVYTPPGVAPPGATALNSGQVTSGTAGVLVP